MTTDARWCWGSPILALGILLLAGNCPRAADDKPPAVPLSDADFDRLVDQSGKTIREALAGKMDSAAIERARTAAVLVATVAQYSQDANNTARRAAVREVALKVAGDIKNNELEQARKEAGNLAKPPAAKTPAPVPIIGKQISFLEVMHHFSPMKLGGAGGEKKLDDLVDNPQARKTGALPAKELNDDLILLALRSAAIGELVKGHTDDKVKKAPEEWKKYAEEMRRYGLDLAGATRDKDGKAAWKALNSLSGSCSSCHKKFDR